MVPETGAPPAGDQPRGRASDSIDATTVARSRAADNRCRRAAAVYARMGWPAFPVFYVPATPRTRRGTLGRDPRNSAGS
jgi:hypothetical protein